MRSGPVALIAATVLAASTVADAKPPALNLSRADHAARAEADDTVAMWADSYDPTADAADDPGAAVFITGYDLDPCDRVSRSAAECDVTYTLNDGSQCDALIKVRTTRRGRLAVRERDFTCDD